MKQSSSSFLAGSAQREARAVRLLTISRASRELLRTWQEAQTVNPQDENVPGILLGEMDWRSELHQLLYDWREDDWKLYCRAYSQQDLAPLIERTEDDSNRDRLPRLLPRRRGSSCKAVAHRQRATQSGSEVVLGSGEIG